MSGSLHDALDDLAADAVPDIVRDDLAALARDRGRSRQRRRRFVGGAVALGLAALALVVALPITGRTVGLTPAGDAGRGVSGYPQRIGHQWRLGELPDRPGPIAGLMKDIQHWYAVAADGHRWRLPGTYMPEPALAPDGRRIWYRPGFQEPYVLHDLVTGERTTPTQFRAVRNGVYYAAQRGYWSPDGQRLAVHAQRMEMVDGVRKHEMAVAAVLGPGGAFESLPVRQGSLAGWAGDDALLWRFDGGVNGQVTHLDGAVVRTITLRPSPAKDALGGDWVVSPDGTEVIIRESGPADSYLRRFALADGAQIGDPVPLPGWEPSCRDGWAGSTPSVSLFDRDEDATTAGTGLVQDDRIESIVVIEPRIDSLCFIWAADALAGGPHWSLFGRSTLFVTWWWREVLLVLLAVTGLLALHRCSERRHWRRIMRGSG
jgi:hypothetical protein